MERFIRVGKELVAVSEEIHQEYYKMARRERYMERDIKVGRIAVDMNKENVTFVASKEDSIERLMEQGVEFEDDCVIEDIICDKATLLILQEAMSELNREEQELINDLYYKNLSSRKLGEKLDISHVAVGKRHRKVLEKLKKYFS